MTHTIYKYELEPAAVQIIYLPAFAQVLSVHNQNEKMVVWALVDSSPDVVKEPVQFRIIGTGNDASGADGCTFLGTVLMNDGQYVWHTFYKVLN